MNNFTLIAISIGLAMDAFAVSLSEGIALKKHSVKYGISVGLLFGGFQAIMPLIGWYTGSLFSKFINNYSHIISFVLLIGIGAKMIYEGYEEETCARKGICKISGDLVLLGVATSIDALAIGFTFAMIPEINIVKSISVIGIITFIISFLGVYLGSKIGKFINTKMEYVGGGILIFIAFKTLISHYL